MYLAKLVSDLSLLFSPENFYREFPAVDESYFISVSNRRAFICGFIQNVLSLFLSPYKKLPLSLKKALRQEISAFLSRVYHICVVHSCAFDQNTKSLFDK